MTTVLFILTIVFVAYVVYTMVNDSSGGASRVEAHAPEAAKKPAAAKRERAPQPKQEAEKPSSPAAQEAAPTGLRNPGTGEVSAVPTNYRFAKRWIKEAMVSEGLLDRIYKNNELEGENGEKVRQALESFKGLEKYQA